MLCLRVLDQRMQYNRHGWAEVPTRLRNADAYHPLVNLAEDNYSAHPVCTQWSTSQAGWAEVPTRLRNADAYHPLVNLAEDNYSAHPVCTQWSTSRSS